MQPTFAGLFPKCNPRNTRVAINFFPCNAMPDSNLFQQDESNLSKADRRVGCKVCERAFGSQSTDLVVMVRRRYMKERHKSRRRAAAFGTHDTLNTLLLTAAPILPPPTV
ncbi:unnamed protein product [Phytophthora lilii]|uniref:Unnamed protein product n=1 Tax=Phytophthora lilii TaxID=2077276 RepID=A0A9W7DAZ8_9STRA|nr:unnamed protein product [Phytophthora lilii]